MLCLFRVGSTLPTCYKINYRERGDAVDVVGRTTPCASPEYWPADMPWTAVGEEARAVRAYPTVTANMFEWGGVELSPDDLPSLLKPDGKGIELNRRCQEEV